jgi:hypothetical protein
MPASSMQNRLAINERGVIPGNACGGFVRAVAGLPLFLSARPPLALRKLRIWNRKPIAIQGQ